LLSVVATGSPAQAAVSGLVTGSQSGTIPVPLLPAAGAAVLAVVATAVACALSSRRSA
ncbi:MAG: ABC transporter, partial [Streptomycetaceae bacterium]|nr:ABC transporter [Streptomycetaceae bacterium]